MKRAVEKVAGVVRGIFMYWEPIAFSITTYVCTGTEANYLEERKD